jgi:Fibronectin type III domain
VSITTPALTVADTTAPSVPTGLVASVVSQTQINLSWIAATDNVKVAGYKVYRDGTLVATVTTGTSHGDNTLTAGTAYKFTVAAYDAAGQYVGPVRSCIRHYPSCRRSWRGRHGQRGLWHASLQCPPGQIRSRHLDLV